MATPSSLSDSPPDRFAFAGDWHGNTNWANGCLLHLAAKGIDTVLHLGDFGIWPWTEGKKYLDSVEEMAARHDIRILFVDGNHEDFHQIEKVERDEDGLGLFRDHIIHLPRGFRWEWGGIRFGALGGATSVDRKWRTPGASWWPQEAITWQDAQRFVDGGPVDIVLTHDVPTGVKVPGITWERGVANWGAEAMQTAKEHQELLARALEPTKPKLVVHGHMHTRYSGIWKYDGGIAKVEGLDCDGTTREKNLWVVDLEGLAVMIG